MDASRGGAALFITFIMMLMLAGLALAIGVFSQNSLVTGQSQLLDKQAFFVGEAGQQRARQLLGTGEVAVGCGENTTFGAGQYNVTTAIAAGGTLTLGPYTITSDGYVPNDTSPLMRRQLVTSGLTPAITLGTNLSLTATASASSSSGGHAPGQANDGNLSTRWESNVAGAGSSLAMDHGSATAVDEIIVRERGGATDTITSLTIEWSDDGLSWTGVSCLVTLASPASGSNQVFTSRFNQESHRFYHALFTAVPVGQRAQVLEMEDYNTTLAFTTNGNTQTSF